MHLRSWACSRGGPYAQCKTVRLMQDRTLNTWPHARTLGRAFNTGPGPYGQCAGPGPYGQCKARSARSMQGVGSMQGRTLNGPCARNKTVRSKQNPCGQRETNLDNSGGVRWNMFQKQQKKHYKPAHTSQASGLSHPRRC